MVGNVSPQTLAVARMIGRHSIVRSQCARKVHSLPTHQTGKMQEMSLIPSKHTFHAAGKSGVKKLTGSIAIKQSG